MNYHYKTPFGDYNLRRIPDSDKNLQAWNSADLYILKQLSDWFQAGEIDLKKVKILIINDAFGALSVPLSQFGCDSYSDSFISHDAALLNIKNNCPDNIENITLIKSTDNINKKYDLVLFKEVKNQVFFKEEMHKLVQCLKPETLILGGIMAKNLQKNTLNILSNTIGPAHASLTWKKARLLFVNKDAEQKKAEKSDAVVIASYQLEHSNETIYSLANVFCRNKLDIGTRFFLQHFPGDNSSIKKEFKKIVDLGCGNGVLSLKAAQVYPDASITCIDESYMAVASAKMTLEANLQSNGTDYNYLAANALSDFSADSADLILCNPPFHQEYVVGDAIAWQMFKQSKKVLEKGGELWIVGNRHLAYHLKLQKIFGNQKLIASNKKFVIIKAVKNQ